MFTKFKKTRSTIVAGVTVKLTGTLGSRPSLKLLIVPKWPLCLQRDQVVLALLPTNLIDLYTLGELLNLTMLLTLLEGPSLQCTP